MVGWPASLQSSAPARGTSRGSTVSCLAARWLARARAREDACEHTSDVHASTRAVWLRGCAVLQVDPLIDHQATVTTEASTCGC